MTSAPHLSSEDRAEYGRLLDEALRTAHERPELGAVGRLLTAEQLRGMALDAIAFVAQTAAAEHERYAALRDALRAPRPLSLAEALPAARSAARGTPQGAAADDDETGATRVSVLGDPDRTGSGVVAAIAVLVPVLAAIAAVIFLLVGYLLEAVGALHDLSDSFVGVGWFFAAVMALGAIAAGAALVVMALRNGATQIRSDGGTEPPELAEAREAWRVALVEKGIVPFLRDSLRMAEADEEGDDAESGDAQRRGGGPHGRAAGTQTRPPAGQGRAGTPQQLPRFGYSRPDFSSPGDGRGGGNRPRYSSPDFTSPDYGGPEHQPE